MRLSFMASIMIMLVISLPFYTSLSLAAINSVTVKGSQGVEGLVAPSDSVDVETELEGEVAEEDIIIKLFEEENPECNYDSGMDTTECSYSSEENYFERSSAIVRITEYKGGQVEDYKDKKVHVDRHAPVITGIDSEGEIFEISLKDETCEDCSCAGIGEINVETEETKTIDVQDSDCEYTAEINMSEEGIELNEGKNEICFSATDRFGNEGEKECIEENIDTSAPESESVQLLGKEGYPLKYISPTRGLEAVVVANFSERELNKVTADFSDFNPRREDMYSNMTAECEKAGTDMYTCKWDLILRGEGDVEYKIVASDEKGNSKGHEGAVELETDETPPIINDIYINKEVSGENLYVKEGKNIIRAEFEDDGSGYANEEVYLNFKLGSTNLQNEKAAECSYNNDAWECWWEINIQEEEGSGSAEISEETKDDAGNRLSDTLSKEVMVDTQAPEVKNEEKARSCPYQGQTLELTLEVKDENRVFVNSKPSKITANNNTYEGSCAPIDDDKHECTLSIDELVPDHTSERLKINITDSANNQQIHYADVEVCEKIQGATSDDVGLEHHTSTEINRKMLSFVELPVVVDLELETESGIEIADKSARCDSKTKDTRLLNARTKSPVLITALKKETAEENPDSSKINISCELDLIMREGNQIYSEPVSKELNLTVNSNKIGSMDNSVEDKLEQIEDDIEGVEDDIEKYEEWNKWLSMICTLAESMAQLNAVMGLVKSVVYAIAGAMTNYPPTNSAGWALWGWVCSFTSTVNEYVTEYVWYPPWSEGWGNTGQWVKNLCMIYSCKLCTLDYVETTADLTGIDSKVISLAGGGLTSGLTRAIWDDEKKKTNQISLMLGEVNMDPFKSIHAARSCLCVSGIVYNLKKDKQIKCMYKNCLEENAEEGLPTDVCDEAYRMRECLYVEGAQWKLLGSNEFFAFFENTISLIIRNMPLIVGAEAWGKGCGMPDDSQKACKGSGSLFSHMPALKDLGCHVSGAGLQVSQVGGFSDIADFDKYSGDLEGDTVC
ncbi:MAG: hypothetical protein ACOCZ6_00665 [Nanoarchaeota archaeon]